MNQWTTVESASVPHVMKCERITYANLDRNITGLGVVDGILYMAMEHLVFQVNNAGRITNRSAELNPGKRIKVITAVVPSDRTLVDPVLVGRAGSPTEYIVLDSYTPGIIQAHQVGFVADDHQQLYLENGVPACSPRPPMPVRDLSPLIGGVWCCNHMSTRGYHKHDREETRSWIFDTTTQCVFEVSVHGVGYVAGPFTEITGESHAAVHIAVSGPVIYMASGISLYRITRHALFVYSAQQAPCRRVLADFPGGRHITLLDGSVNACAELLSHSNGFFRVLLGTGYMEHTEGPRLAVTTRVFHCVLQYFHMGNIELPADDKHTLSALFELAEFAWYIGAEQLSRAALYRVLSHMNAPNRRFLMHDETPDWYSVLARINHASLPAEELALAFFKHVFALLLLLNTRACVPESALPDEVTRADLLYLHNTPYRHMY